MEVNKALRVMQELFAFEHTAWGLCLVYIGMLLASFSVYKLVFITVAFFSARLAAMTMNRYVGREYDMLNEEKRNRESMGIRKKSLLAIFVIFGLIFMSSAYALNPLAFVFSPLILLLFIIDPHLKKHTKERHFNIGLMHGFGALGGYIGANGAFPATLPVYMLLLAALFIGSGSDMLYSIPFMEFDRKHKLKTYASAYGADTAKRSAYGYHIIGSIFLIIFALSLNSRIVFAGSVVAIAILMSQHHGRKAAEKNFLQIGTAHYKSYAGIVLLASVILFIVFLK